MTVIDCCISLKMIKKNLVRLGVVNMHQLLLKRLLCFAVVDCLQALTFGHTMFDLGAST